MRLIRARLSAMVIAVFSTVCPGDDKVDRIAGELLAAHNREREREHKAPLKLSAKLCESAAAHAGDMARHQKLDHKGSDDSTVAGRVKRVGYVYVRVGENIANGQKTVDQAMESWMKSPGHRANILADFTEMGAARAADDEGLFYWCVNFAIPMPRLKPDLAAAAVIKEINAERESSHQVPLKVEPSLGKGAMALSAAMAAQDSLEVKEPFKIIGEKTIESKEIRLQLSANVPTPEAAARELLGDEAGELDSFREVGVGYAVAKNGTPYWCAIFAKPAGVKRPGRPR